jgi:phage-related protein
MVGVSFDQKHSYNDFGLILKHATIGMPKPKTEVVNVPGLNGVIDLTDYYGEPVFENRTITLTFLFYGASVSYHVMRTNLARHLHGKKMNVVFDDDIAYYYLGRCTIDNLETTHKGAAAQVVITVDADPYKYEVASNGADWLWDTFSFEDGIINNNQFTVNGTETVTLTNRDMIVSPEIVSSAAMTCTFNKKTYAIRAGKQTMYEMRLQPGDNVLKFTGSGTVTITYRGGVI